MYYVIIVTISEYFGKLFSDGCLYLLLQSGVKMQDCVCLHCLPALTSRGSLKTH